MTLEERTINILDAAIREFIRTGEPISSNLLFDNYNFGIRPARIRSELQKLTDGGFLEQPYHSSGRIPSDKGIQFFVERIIELEPEEKRGDNRFEHLFRKSEWPTLLKSLSHELGILGVADDFRSGAIYKEGLDNLMEQLDWDYPEEIKEVVRDFENLETRIRQAQNLFENNDSVNVFIGRRSPVTRSRELAVIAGDYRSEGKQVLILAIGPKRMNYQKVIRILRNIVR